MMLIFIISFIWAANAFSFLADYKKDGAREGAYYAYERAPEDLGFKVFLTYLLLSNQFIPFELIIMVETTRLYYNGFLEKDIKLHNEEAGKAIKVNNLGMVEDMGMIEWLFCDKTGTLTKN